MVGGLSKAELSMDAMPFYVISVSFYKYQPPLFTKVKDSDMSKCGADGKSRNGHLSNFKTTLTHLASWYEKAHIQFHY